MQIKPFLPIIFLITSPMVTANAPLHKIYADHQITFFCEQKFSSQNKIQWIPIIPLKQLAQNRLCYREKICINRKGVRFKGLRCCQEVDPLFQKMKNDLHNWVPETNSVKQQRRNAGFGLVKEPIVPIPGCHFYLDSKRKRLEPSPLVRGMIARTYLYMKDSYHLSLPPEDLALFMAWHQQYPVTAWERTRNQRIRDLQGNGNHYVL